MLAKSLASVEEMKAVWSTSVLPIGLRKEKLMALQKEGPAVQVMNKTV